MKPCTIGKRHSWNFVKNVVSAKLNGRCGVVSKRGFYRCECGATKYGTAGNKTQETRP